MLTSQLPTTSCEPKSLIWPDLKIGHVEVDFLEYFLFCLPLPCSAFIPPVPSNLWYEEHPMALQIFSCYFGSFGCFWLAAAQRSCAGIPVPACLSSHLLWHKGLFYLPCCTPCSNPAILHISSEAFLLSCLPPRICHPALLLTALLSTQQMPSELGRNCIQRVFLFWNLWSAVPLLSSFLLYTQVCVFLSVHIGDWATVGIITTCVLAHSPLFVKSAVCFFFYLPARWCLYCIWGTVGTSSGHMG